MISMLREFNFNKSGILKFLSLSFLTVTFVLLTHQEVQAADVSTDIEAGATTIDGTDTFIIDGTNDGAAGSDLTFNGGPRSLTISSDGTDGDDVGNLGTIDVADNNDTSTLIVNDASNGDNLVVIVNGNVTGDCCTAIQDLDITVAANSTNDAGDTTLESVSYTHLTLPTILLV